MAERDWGEIEEGYLHRLYALAEASADIFAPEKPLKKLTIKFKYLSTKTEEKVEINIPESWTEKQIEEFEEVLWKLMTIY